MRSRSADAAAASTGAETAFMERIVEPGRVPGPVLTHRPQRAARLRLLRSTWVADRDPPRGCWRAYSTCDSPLARSRSAAVRAESVPGDRMGPGERVCAACRTTVDTIVETNHT